MRRKAGREEGQRRGRRGRRGRKETEREERIGRDHSMKPSINQSVPADTRTYSEWEGRRKESEEEALHANIAITCCNDPS